MNTEEIIEIQKEERRKCIDAIINSESKNKLIIAGAGTGKTYTFLEVLKANSEGNNIALTFINSLTNDMASVIDDLAEVKTFHAYCKKILHEQNGKVDLYPFLTQIIEEDAYNLGLILKDFDKQFQLLNEDSPEVNFYIDRGDYYEAVSFNDSVYRLYRILLDEPDIVPSFDQILIDEFQDFNFLEVSFINELEKKGNILIVGDDDQSVYDNRYASPKYLREKYHSKNYEYFDLPFCGRCPEAIVKAANVFLGNAEKTGHLTGRVQKRFECYIGSKESDSLRFPYIHTVQCTTGKIVAKYVDKVIQTISIDDIEESWKDGSRYSTVLITGPRQYLTIIQNVLADKYPQMVYKHSEQQDLRVIDGYNILLNNSKSNLGWRVLL
ncbi:UvrD-helicase domain-containing protein, partial [Chloroflexota bacterium]